jgi:Uma2 family endonuclease
MAAPARPISPEQYLRAERASHTKHEMIGGEVFAMSGASRWHGRIVGNISAELREALRGWGCSSIPGDLRVRIPQTEAYLYPDVVVYCGEGKWRDDQFDTLENPVVIVEVLSPTTESFDRSVKFDQYRLIQSLQAYVLVSQNQTRVELYERRDADTWVYVALTRLENQLQLTHLNVSVPLTEIYLDVPVEPIPGRDQQEINTSEGPSPLRSEPI